MSSETPSPDPDETTACWCRMSNYCPLHGRLCAACGHSIWFHPEMAWHGTDGTCSGEEDCKCEEFKRLERHIAAELEMQIMDGEG